MIRNIFITLVVYLTFIWLVLAGLLIEQISATIVPSVSMCIITARPS